jgi:hypothetical protein
MTTQPVESVRPKLALRCRLFGHKWVSTTPGLLEWRNQACLRCGCRRFGGFEWWGTLYAEFEPIASMPSDVTSGPRAPRESNQKEEQ